jgi:integrase
VHKNGRSYWRLRLPNPSGTGFSERQFSSEARARAAFEAAYIQYQNHGLKAGTLGAKERGEAIAAGDILRPFGVSVIEAARFYSLHHLNLWESKPVGEAVAELLRAKKGDGLSACYQKDLRNRLRRFVERFGTRKISELGVAEIDSWLRALEVGPVSRNTFAQRLNTLFAFALARRWCTTNPLAKIEKAKSVGQEPGILSPEEFGRLLEAANAQTLPYWAIGGFAGLRSAELERLEWQDIDFERLLVEVTRGKAKTASRRHVPLRPSLAAILSPYRDRIEGKVCPPNLRKLLEADRKRADIKKWPPNALRHSFASYHLEQFQNPGILAVEMGHTDQDLLQKFYRRPGAPRSGSGLVVDPPPRISSRRKHHR